MNSASHDDSFPQLNPQKYFELLKKEGVEVALTALHMEKEDFEQETFEGKDGYDRAKWEFLESVRELSRELWQAALLDQALIKKGELPKSRQ